MESLSFNDVLKLEATGADFAYTMVYHTYGKLNAEKSNVKWVFHALTANSDVADWWSGIFGKGRILDPDNDFIICANMLGSCYGSTCPLDKIPGQNRKYWHDFPLITLRDQVHAFHSLKKHLGIDQIKMGIGGSMGGSALLEWNASYPGDFENSLFVGTSAKESSWGKAIHTVHKMAIETDPTWKEDRDDAGQNGLRVARGVGMLFYRTSETYNRTQIDDKNSISNYKSDSYIRYQGKKLVNRFNALSYYALLETLDTHNISRGRESLEKVLSGFQTRSLIIGINSDILYPRIEQEFLAKYIPGNELVFIDSKSGHDGFLTETDQINEHALRFMKSA